MQSYSFDGNDPMSYDAMKRRREIAEARASSRRRAPKTVGEGLYSAGSDILQAIIARKAAKGMGGLRDSASTDALATFGRISGGGGGELPAAPDAQSSMDVGTGGDPDLVAYIRQAAVERDIDPDIALKVARSEGLNADPAEIWQSRVVNKAGIREPSYFPFQLLAGGPGTGYPRGMGNDFMDATGLDIRDPANLNASIDFALDQAKKGGWGPWYGAAKVGVGKWDGLRAPGDKGASLNTGAPPNQVAGLGNAGVAEALIAADKMNAGGVQVADASGFGAMGMDELKGLDLNSMSPEDLQAVKRRVEQLKSPPQIQTMSVEQLKGLDLNSLSPQELQIVKQRFQELRPAAPQGEVTRGGALPPTISPNIDTRMDGVPQLAAPQNIETRKVARLDGNRQARLDRFNDFAQRSGSKQLANADPTEGILGVLSGLDRPSNRAGFPARPRGGDTRMAAAGAGAPSANVAQARIDNPYLSKNDQMVAQAMLDSRQAGPQSVGGDDEQEIVAMLAGGSSTAAPMQFASLNPNDDFRTALAQPQGAPQSAQALQGIPTSPAPANEPEQPQLAQSRQLTPRDVQDLLRIMNNPASRESDRAYAKYLLQQNQARQMTPAQKIEMQLRELQLQKTRKDLNTAPKREMFKDANGRQRYSDTRELAVPDLEIEPEFRILSAEETATMGLPEGTYQMGRDGRVYPIRSQSNGISFTTADGTEIQIGGSASGLKQEGKNDANLLKEAQTAAAGSSDLKQTTSMLRKANKTSGYKGPGAGIIGAADDVLESLGGNLPGTDKDQSGPRAIMRAGGLRVALENVSKTKGAISNAEMGLFMAASPGMQNTEPGNAALLDMVDQIADRTVMRATAMEKWLNENQSLRGFSDAWETWLIENPLIVETPDGGVKLHDGGGAVIDPETQSLIDQYAD